jgi:hypothetical protein
VLERVEVVRGAPVVVRLRLSQPLDVTSSALAGDGTASPRIIIDLPGAQLGAGARGAVDGAGPVIRVRTGQFTQSTARVVLDLTEKLPYALERDGGTVNISVPAGAAPAAGRASERSTAAVSSPAAAVSAPARQAASPRRATGVPRLRKLYLDYEDLGRLLSPSRR